jgi:hypothetical protein
MRPLPSGEIFHGRGKERDMTTWVVLSVSCKDCNSMALGVYDHEPTEEDIDDVNGICGGMLCIKNHVIVVDKDEPVSFSQEEY